MGRNEALGTDEEPGTETEDKLNPDILQIL